MKPEAACPAGKLVNLRLVTLLTVLAVALAGCTGSRDAANVDLGEDAISTESVSGSAGAVGGSVKNSAPTVTSFAPSATTGENRGGFVVVFTGAIREPNAESQLQNLTVAATGPLALSTNHAVTNAEKTAATEPNEFGADGFKVWTGTPNDGILNFKFQQSFPAFTPAGAYTFMARATDAPGLSGASAPVAITLTAFSDITINPTPVSATGAPLAGQNWGQWEAEPGAANVEAANYVKLVNTGDVANSRVVVDFDGAFVGATNRQFTIPVGNNVQFAWWEDTSPAATSPNEGAYDWKPANSEGTVTVQFTGKGNVIYVTYRIVQLPGVLEQQSYGIAFTVTEL